MCFDGGSVENGEMLSIRGSFSVGKALHRGSMVVWEVGTSSRSSEPKIL